MNCFSSVERYLDVEAEENNATDAEGDLDSYDADFIDDRCARSYTRLVAASLTTVYSAKELNGLGLRLQSLPSRSQTPLFA